MEILDHTGQPLQKVKPNKREIAVAGINDRYSSYPSNGLTPRRLSQILKEADSGDVYRQMELFEEMEEKDTHLFSQFQTRKNAVLGIDYDVMPFSDDERDKKIAEFIEEELKNLDDLEDVFLDLLDAIGKGFAVAEIIWKIKNNKVSVGEIKRREQKKFFWDETNTFKVVTDEEPTGIELPDNKFLIHYYKAKSGHPSRAGVLRIVAWMYLFKNYDIKDWVAFTEIYGMPLRLGKYGAGASEDDKKALLDALINIASDAAGIIPEGTEIEFQESGKTSSIDVFESLANFCNSEMSKAVLGQTLTSEIGSSGSFAASKTHDGVRHDLLESDCKSLAKTIKKCLIKPLVMFNFGQTDRLPYIKFHFEEPEDSNQTAEVYTKLVEMGLPISQEHLYEKFGVPKPEEGQSLLVKTNQALAFKDTTYKVIANKVDDEPVITGEVSRKYQKTIDGLTDEATAASLPFFTEMFKPIEKLVGQVDSLEALAEKLKSPDAVMALYKEMNSSDLEDLLHRSMFIADLLGRMKEDEEHPI